MHGKGIPAGSWARVPRQGQGVSGRCRVKATQPQLGEGAWGGEAWTGDSPKHRQNTAARVKTEQSLTNECRGETRHRWDAAPCALHTQGIAVLASSTQPSAPCGLSSCNVLQNSFNMSNDTVQDSPLKIFMNKGVGSGNSVLVVAAKGLGPAWLGDLAN